MGNLASVCFTKESIVFWVTRYINNIYPHKILYWCYPNVQHQTVFQKIQHTNQSLASRDFVLESYVSFAQFNPKALVVSPRADSLV